MRSFWSWSFIGGFTLVISLASFSPARADAASDALTKLLTGTSIDQSMFAEGFFVFTTPDQFEINLQHTRDQGGQFLEVERQGGAYFANFSKGFAAFEIVLDKNSRILEFYCLGFRPTANPLPLPTSDDQTIIDVLSRLFSKPTVDLSLFSDADLATKISNNLGTTVASLGNFRAVVLEGGSYFARFDSLEIPIFVYVTSDGKIESLWLYPPIPISYTDSN